MGRGRIEAIFYTGDDLLSNLIKNRTKGECSHCGVLLDGLLVADTDFIRAYSLRPLPWGRKDFFTIPLRYTPEQEGMALEWIQAHIGTPYDNWENWRYLIRTGEDNPHAMNCVEALWNMHTTVMFGMCDSAKSMSPEDVAYNLRYCWR